MTASTTAPAARTVRCPGCSGLSRYAAENLWRPFCSERCKNLDFGAWASEHYRVAAPPVVDGDDSGENNRPAVRSGGGDIRH
ncbi:MAG: DNA gyrase inhibitor YacG [Betaproteobacteria bacterium]|nr:DNA gyrase inhibitor YacG [Betaproteobacteria bacterium]MDE2123638.1 DNA gyrase inhibitor YacG [Betaproteobacteria bacterium]MDE2187476.1 DNA gyrase inhibitor YacG [Betaproteobacteria bacterium]MDE2326045.1 DNA gyrase inhibitor YacG [Betaproteobacteria bacterium]